MGVEMLLHLTRDGYTFRADADGEFPSVYTIS